MQVTIASRRAGSRLAGAGAGAGAGDAGETGTGGSAGSACCRVGPKGSQVPGTYSASCWYAIDWNDIRCSGETPCFSIAARCSGVE